MTQNLNQHNPYEDEIDLIKIIKILIESKKLIILTTLIFIIASIIYSLSLKPSFNSSTKLEIGYAQLDNGDRKLIESSSNLISNLNIFLLKNTDSKFNQDVSINSVEGRILNLETISSSAEQNENLLTEIINYIDERHSNLAVLITDQKKHQISKEIDLIESKISFIKAKQLDENQAKKLTINRNLEILKSKISFIKAKQLDENQLMRSQIKDKTANLKSSLLTIDLEISQLEKVIIEVTNNLSLLKRNELQTERAANSPTLEQIIFSYNTKINALNAQKYNNVLETKSLNNQLTLLENDTIKSDELFNLEQEQKILENQLTLLENDTIKSDELFSLEQEQKILENELQLLMTQTQTKTLPIGNIQTNNIKPETLLTISLGIILGFFTSFLLVFIRNFVKNYKESQA
jgi:capsular polysaccharide biosynthesis protein